MNYKAYSVVEPGQEIAPGKDFDRLAKRWSRRCTRLLDAIEDFVSDPTTPGFRIAPVRRGFRHEADPACTVEVYLVPFVEEEAAALLLLNHETKVISFIAVYDEFDGYSNQTQWEQIIELAEGAI